MNNEENLLFLKEAFDYNPGTIIECEVDGRPGYKASGEGKCYAYDTGDDEGKKDAKRKAYMQDYHKQKRKRITGAVVESIAYFTGPPMADALDGGIPQEVDSKPTNKPVNENTTDTYSGGGPFGGSEPLGVGNNPMGDQLNNSMLANKKDLNRENNMNDTETIIRTAQKVVREASWFDGSSASIYNRMEIIQDVIDELKMASSSPSVDDGSLSKFANTLIELETEKEQLQKVASEYVDYDTEEYLQSLPGGTVASAYRTTDFGTVDMGEDDGSTLYKVASKVNQEFEEADWINFVTAGAETWVEDQFHGLLESQLSTREAAVYYVEQKTLPILDVEKRAAVINNFVDNVEIVRREKNASKTTSEFNTARVASKKSNFVVDDVLGTTANWF